MIEQNNPNIRYSINPSLHSSSRGFPMLSFVCLFILLFTTRNKGS